MGSKEIQQKIFAPQMLQFIKLWGQKLRIYGKISFSGTKGETAQYSGNADVTVDQARGGGQKWIIYVKFLLMG